MAAISTAPVPPQIELAVMLPPVPLELFQGLVVFALEVVRLLKALEQRGLPYFQLELAELSPRSPACRHLILQRAAGCCCQMKQFPHVLRG